MPRPLRVGMPVSLTGAFHVQGNQAFEGVSRWVKDTNRAGGILVKELGQRLALELCCHDDESKPKKVTEATEHLIEDDQVDLLLGPYSSVLTLASARAAEVHGQVLWNHGGSSDRLWRQGLRWTVSVLTPASQYFHGVIELARHKEPSATRIALLYSSKGSFPMAVAQGAETCARSLGFEVVFRGQYEPPATALQPLLRQAKGARPHILLGVGRIEDDILLARQMLECGSTVPLVALVAAGVRPFRDALGDQAGLFVGPSQWEPGVYSNPDYGPSEAVLGLGDADYPLAQAYAAGLVAQRCIEEAGTLDQDQLRRVANQLDFTTFYGRFKLDPQTGRQVGHAMVVVRWQADRKVVVWPRMTVQANESQTVGASPP